MYHGFIEALELGVILDLKTEAKDDTRAIEVEVSHLGVELIRNVVAIGLTDTGNCSFYLGLCS